MNLDNPLFPQLFKGIAMFTPGGDLIYSIDPTKQSRWHLHLCAAIQEILALPEPPHFLVPGYTATIDRWLDPQTQQVRTSAEIYRPVQRHQELLNAIFGIKNVAWQVASWQEESCDPSVTETYRHQFPQLWEDHDLIVRFERAEGFFSPSVGQGSWLTNHSTVSHSRMYEDATEAMRPNLSRQEPPLIETKSGDEFPGFASKDASSLEISAQERLCSDPDVIEPQPESLRAQGYVLRLFVSGNSVTTENTLKTLHQLLEKSLAYPYTLKVIDVFKHPEQAEANQISATPTLLRVWPSPVRRIVGDLNDVEKVLRVLEAPSSRG